MGKGCAAESRGGNCKEVSWILINLAKMCAHRRRRRACFTVKHLEGHLSHHASTARLTESPAAATRLRIRGVALAREWHPTCQARSRSEYSRAGRRALCATPPVMKL